MDECGSENFHASTNFKTAKVDGFTCLPLEGRSLPFGTLADTECLSYATAYVMNSDGDST